MSENTWDQRKTLTPPSFEGALKQILNGIEIGDELIDKLPLNQVSPCKLIRNRIMLMENIPQSPEPEWVNWEMVKYGQNLWLKYLGATIISLVGVLLHGYCFTRIAEVLTYSGYAKDPIATSERYIATGYFIMDWLIYPLDDPNSKGRKSIYTIRSIHSFARRMTMKLFSKESGEGIPLSQFDMAIVQLAFSGICLQIMQKHIGLILSDSEIEAMTHTWRLIGWHLGILDDYNICSSVKYMNECLDDFNEWKLPLLTTCRESTYKLQKAFIIGFGKYVFFGVEFYNAYIVTTEEMIYQLKLTKFKQLPYMNIIIMSIFNLFKSSFGNYIYKTIFVYLYRNVQYQSKFTNKIRIYLSLCISTLMDNLIWPFISTILSLYFNTINFINRLM